MGLTMTHEATPNLKDDHAAERGPMWILLKPNLKSSVHNRRIKKKKKDFTHKIMSSRARGLNNCRSATVPQQSRFLGTDKHES